MFKNTKRVVAHINGTFINKSQTFIYTYIRNLKDYHPVCLTAKIVNQDQFPFPNDDIYNVANKSFSYQGIYSQWRHGFIGMNNRITHDILEKKDAKCIHAHFGQTGVFALTSRRKLKIPLITSFYGYDLSKLIQVKYWANQYKTLFADGDCFLVEGPFMRASLAKAGCPEPKIKIQRIALPLDKIKFLTRTPKKNDEKVILIFSGRFMEKKGLCYALQALDKVRQKYTNFEFRIIGDGPERLKVMNLIDRLGLNDFVKLLGFLRYDEYLNEMQKADILIHPSVTASDGDSEGGAPTTILEAQAMGIPVISTDHADIPNIVVPGKSALLSPEGDVHQLSNNILFLMENRNLWPEMGAAGRKFVEDNHDIKNEVTGLEKIYGSLIK